MDIDMDKGHGEHHDPSGRSGPAAGADHAVFVQGNELDGNTIHVFARGDDGKLKVLQQPLASGQEVLCWLERAGNFFYGGNTGNSTVSGYRMDKRGKLSLTNEVGIATPPSAKSQGAIDLDVTEDERFAYVQNATSGTIDGFRVETNGAPTKVTTAEGLPAFGESGMEGIAAVCAGDRRGKAREVWSVAGARSPPHDLLGHISEVALLATWCVWCAPV
ncbi:beta-propeller fold lactonase family protein [Streptomyces lanatus]|uniref:Beta-propeller fold lactonase family protein n=1 Tax=Streptomyces lanatus TaxID=66900 RepID=A0ABV1Y4S2_9ACTN|nr:beta-propeller fold lactonase family protein [Streptomyces lanatus]